MNLTDAPSYTPTPFANSGTKNTIPVSSQQGITPGAASYTDGFPPLTFQPISSGGVPPFGADFNGIFYQLSLGQRYTQAGGVYGFDATFATGIGGYPKGAMLKRADGQGYWLNLADANTTNPDTGGANWAAMRANLGTTSIAMVAGNNTPTADKLAAGTLLLTGTPATAATLILPLTAGASWIVANNTTGAGTVNVQGVTGASVTIEQATSLHVYCDGTNYLAIAAPTTGAYLPLHGTADAAVKLATVRSFIHTGLVTAATVNFDGSANVTFNVTGLDVAGALGYTPANNANVVHTSGNESVGGVKSFTSAMNGTSATFTGLVTVGTFNATGSDRRLKRNIRKVAPRPLHRSIPFVSYELKVDGSRGRGAIAQKVQQFERAYVGTFTLEGKTRLSIDKPSMAYEQAIWCGQEIDRQAKRIAKLERALERARIEPRKRGFARRVLEAIW